MIKQKILVASTNPGKVSELSAMLGDDADWVGLSDFPGIEEVLEDGETFEANARKKALGYAKATGLWTLADDSGLVIDALGGEPGVKSARFSGEKGKNRNLLDHRNMTKVLRLLEQIPAKKRTARFVCCLCLAGAEGVLIETKDTLEGVIVDKESGKNGFGYDPIFFVPALNKTVAQLSRKSKNSISHRGNAIRKFKPLLESLLRNEEKR